MTRYANRNDIKLMLFSVAKMMMPFDGRLGAMDALESLGGRHLSRPDETSNCSSCLRPLRILAMTSAVYGFVLFCLAILPMVCFCLRSWFFQLSRFSMAVFTYVHAVILPAAILIEVRKRFSFLALTARFLYDGLRHNQFLYNWLCLEPVGSTNFLSACSIIEAIPNFSTKKPFIQGDNYV